MKNDIQYVSSPLLDKLGIKHGWFMRYGGVSTGLFESLNGKKGSGDSDKHVDENRIRAIKSLFAEVDSNDKLKLAHIIHEFKTNILQTQDGGEFQGFDASYTTTHSVVLSQTTADCASIVLADSNRKVVMLIHGSWHTLKDHVVRKSVDRVKTIAGTGELTASIGPMICYNCYEFGSEAKDIFNEKYLTASGSAYLVDLKQMVIDQLRRSGVSRIDDVNICTKEDSRFFSHRRDGAHSGRMITLASLTDVVS